MSDPSGQHRPEIVIVRRKVADDLAAGKGGSWKIAYADFVTAMMAFFLVMWLINASNEEVRTQVANYFNPIKLTDSTTGARSLMDTTDVEDTQKKDIRRNGQKPASSEFPAEEAAILLNPPAALDQIESRSAGGKEAGSKTGESDDPTPATNTKKSTPGVGDPFDPKSWENEKPPVLPPGQDGTAKPEEKSTSQDAVAPSEPDSIESSRSGGERRQEKVSGPDQNNDGAESIGEEEKLQDQAAKLLSEIAVALGRASTDLKGSVDVKATTDGLVISLTESEKFEMFKAGSAEPEPETLKLVAAIASTIKTLPGGVYVRGHTDAQPFRNGYYDNWQLSTARAHVARYMLIRGGLEEPRILRVEGVADREPLNEANPIAPENRRIQFFIQMTRS